MEVKRIQSCLFFNQKELLRRVGKEICLKQNQSWDESPVTALSSHCRTTKEGVQLGAALARAFRHVSGAYLPLLLYLLQLAKVL